MLTGATRKIGKNHRSIPWQIFTWRTKPFIISFSLSVFVPNSISLSVFYFSSPFLCMSQVNSVQFKGSLLAWPALWRSASSVRGNAMMEHQQTTGISVPLSKHTHQVKCNEHGDEIICLCAIACVTVCVYVCECVCVCVCVWVSVYLILCHML